MSGESAPKWDRFAHYSRGRALWLLCAMLAMLMASALVPLTVGKGEVATPPPLSVSGDGGGDADQAKVKIRPRDDDLKLYDTAIARISKGENYYSFIVDEHRKAAYPVRPGLAVRLPTMAYLDAAMGVNGDASAPLAMVVAVALMLAVIAVWWRRLGDEGCSERQRLFGTVLMFLGASLGLNRYYFVLHELWAGMLLALAMGLHRPAKGKWLGAWLAAALALAIREHALPFVLLMLAYAAYRRAWREAGAWAVLIAVFGVGLAWHLHLIAAQVLPSDVLGPSWFALRGLGGWLSNVVLSSNLRFLPHYIAGPLVMLMIFGWSGWRSGAGAFATLLYLGYGLAFMIAGRNDNFYWGAVVAPAMFVGLAFVPMAAGSLWRAVRKSTVGVGVCK